MDPGPSFSYKKSRSRVPSPILVLSSLIPAPGSLPRWIPFSNNWPALAKSLFFQSWIWFGCTSNCSARSVSVRSPRNAASATFAMNSGKWFLRFLFLSCSPLSGVYRRKFPLWKPSICPVNGVHISPPVLSRHRFRFTPTSCALFWFPYDDALR